MRRLIRKPTTIWGASIAIAILLFVSLFVVIHGHVSALSGSGRLITIHDRGEDKVILSDAVTVGDAVKQAGITLDSHDVVEPAAAVKMVASEYQVNIYRARPVTVIDGPTREKIVTAYQTGEQIAKDAGISLYPEDETTLSRSDNILADGAGLELTITRAVAFNFTLYGTTSVARTQAKTVGDMLKEKNITIGVNDRVSVPLSTAITADTAIQVWREGKQTITVAEPVNFTVQQIEDADQNYGYKVVQKAGVNGSQNVTYEVDIQNGQEVSRTKISSLVTQTAIQQVEVVGSKISATAGYSSEQNNIMAAAGISDADQGYAAYIIDHENGMWCATRWQGQSICPAEYVALHDPGSQVGYGLCQATPGNKMASAGADWQTNPVTQMIWCTGYAQSRYGGWAAAAAHWSVAHSW